MNYNVFGEPLEEDNMEKPEWFCEKHPELEMGHDGCDGAGILEEARIPMLVLQRRLLAQQIRELKKFYGYNIVELRRLLDLKE